MRCSRLVAAFAALALPTAALALPPAAVGVKWDIPQVQVLAVADVSPDAGLECIGLASTGIRGLYRLATGQLLAELPPDFNTAPTTYAFRDVDNDGRAEILCVNEGDRGQGLGATVGMLDYGSGLVALWPTKLVEGNISGLMTDFMDLNAANPQVLVLSTALKLMLVNATSGAVLYDTTTDPAIPTNRDVDAVLVDDFDVDGHDDVLLTLLNPNNNSKRVFLIGATGGLSTVDDLSGAALVKLQQSWPNPVNGSSTIRFELEQPSRARLRIFDAAGRLVRTILDEHVAAGSHTRVWDGPRRAGTRRSQRHLLLRAGCRGAAAVEQAGAGEVTGRARPTSGARPATHSACRASWRRKHRPRCAPAVESSRPRAAPVT
jgi:hypothetical protein